jgi:putative phosphoesterase
MRPQALAALRGSDLIIHAGDVGNGSILEALKEIAPTLAVKGNVDVKASGLALTALVEAGSALIYVLHDVKELDTDPAALGVHIVVSGHSHKPSQTERGGVLYINPGSAGPRRFRLPVSVATLDLTKRRWSAEFIELKI